MTDWSYIAWACSAESPASTIRAVKISAPTTADADRHDDHPDRRGGDRGERDPEADPATHGLGAGRGPGRAIADAADRGDVARAVGVVAELVAEAADVDVDRAVEDLGAVVAVDRIEQLVARQDAAVGLEDRLEQPELDAGQVGTGRRRGSTSKRSRSRTRSAWLRAAGAVVAVDGVGAARRRRRIDFTRRTSSAGENGLGR